MALTKIVAHDTAGNFTFDSDKITFASGSAALKQLSYANEIVYSSFNSSTDADRASVSATAIEFGTPSVASGKLNLKDALNTNIAYDITGTDIAAGSVEMEITPDYNGAPPNDKTVFSIYETIDVYNNTLVIVHKTGTGNVEYLFYNSSGSLFSTASFGAFLPTLGQAYTFSFNWDSVSGNIRAFVDGTQLGSTITTPGTLTTANRLRIGGNNTSGTQRADFEIDNLSFYNVVRRTSNYTPGSLVIPNYSTDNPTVILSSGTEVDDLVSFSEAATKGSGEEVKYTVVVDGVDKYWSGSAWVTSDGTYAQANTATEINTNISSLDVSSGVTANFKAFLHLDDGIPTPTLELTSYTFEYNFFKSVTDPSSCVVYGKVQDILGSAASNVTLEVEFDPFFHGENIITPPAAQTLNGDGNFDITLYETETVGVEVTFKFSYTENSNSKTRYFYGVTIPNASTAPMAGICYKARK